LAPPGATDRLGQIKPRLLLAVPTYGYSYKRFDITESINAVAEAGGVGRILLLDAPPSSAAYVRPATTLRDWIAPFAAAPNRRSRKWCCAEGRDTRCGCRFARCGVGT
jgi:acetoacetyl-CoA synthetase